MEKECIKQKSQDVQKHIQTQAYTKNSGIQKSHNFQFYEV